MGYSIHLNNVIMNIVILTIILPFPLDSGGAQAQYNMIDALRHKHNITVVFPENGVNRMDAMHELQKRWPQVGFRPYRFVYQMMNPAFLFSKAKRAFKKLFCRNSDRFMVEWMLTPYGYPCDNRFAHFMEKVLREKAADILQVEFYPYLHFVHKLHSDVLKVFIHHELRYIRNRRLLANVQMLPCEIEYMELMQRQEIDDLNCYDMVVTLTDVDSNELQSAGVQTPIMVSPASVNAAMMEYRGWNGKITFLGGYGHTPNKEGVEWFLRNVASLIDWRECGASSVDIIGGGWPVEIETIAQNIKVNRLGFVENLADAAQGSIMIVPILSGSGMRMKILEAAAMGLPLVTTTVGVEGLAFRHEQSCLKADTPEDFAAELSRLMKSEQLRVRLTSAARDMFEAAYSVKATSERRNSVYEKLKNCAEA